MISKYKINIKNKKNINAFSKYILKDNTVEPFWIDCERRLLNCIVGYYLEIKKENITIEKLRLLAYESTIVDCSEDLMTKLDKRIFLNDNIPPESYTRTNYSMYKRYPIATVKSVAMDLKMKLDNLDFDFEPIYKKQVA